VKSRKSRRRGLEETNERNVFAVVRGRAFDDRGRLFRRNRGFVWILAPISVHVAKPIELATHRERNAEGFINRFSSEGNMRSRSITHVAGSNSLRSRNAGSRIGRHSIERRTLVGKT